MWKMKGKTNTRGFRSIVYTHRLNVYLLLNSMLIQIDCLQCTYIYQIHSV